MDWEAIIIIPAIFIGMPWLILHYMTQWRKNRGLSIEDERLLDELHDTARRLDDRLTTIERIMAADNPRWREERFAPAAPQPPLQ
jgi:phage shock protein B